MCRKKILFTESTEEPISIADLQREYDQLVHTLSRQRTQQDPALLMRLTIVMMDLGLYQPSPP